MAKVFLGGICNKISWQEKLKENLNIEYVLPIVPRWLLKDQFEAAKQKAECDFLLFLISPPLESAYLIAEAVDASNKYPQKTIYCFLTSDIDAMGNNTYITISQIRYLCAVGRLIQENGGTWLHKIRTIEDIAKYLNNLS